MSPQIQRVIGVAVLLVAGVLSLPVAAALLDGEGTESWIVPAQLLAVVAIGATVTIALPALARPGADTRRRAGVGTLWGLLAAFAGLLLFWFLISGFNGA